MVFLWLLIDLDLSGFGPDHHRPICHGTKSVAPGPAVTRRPAAVLMFVPYLPGGRKFSITQSSVSQLSKATEVLKASRLPSG